MKTFNKKQHNMYHDKVLGLHGIYLVCSLWSFVMIGKLMNII